jgi:hypothetical protein
MRTQITGILYPSANHRKGQSATWSEAKDGEVVVERCHTLNSEPPHYGEAGSAHQREILVPIRPPDFPGRIQICGAYNLNDGGCRTAGLPKIARQPGGRAGV